MGTFICATDFSSLAENAIHYADEIGQRMQSRMVVMHTLSEPVEAELVMAGQEQGAEEGKGKKKAARTQLKRLLSYLEQNDHLATYDTKLRQGEIVPSIITLAEEERADFIVLGSASKRGGSISERPSVRAQVIQQAPCPVLVVPAHTSFKPIRRMVLATDLRGFSPSDMALVLQLASYFGAQLQVLYVLPKEEPTTRQFVQEELERICKRLPYARTSQHIVVNASVEEGITEFCQSQRTDLLVVGAHSTPAWQQLVGPEFQEPTYPAQVPLLVIHPKKIRF
ncbi:universal stress protein [Rufibacter glacialis]|uniref:Universal stress protein n=1 Tax=Rufibacter glacialis TaxID=1259555 RepID=A0A5M8Q740_9BACT|nr:universal stress protein [Rufibacter glacialis]KAA6430640.1 universal stress protein [Rufibacter glacialis]GGK85384.1 universal stress protein [Rufibacter glacialis]